MHVFAANDQKVTSVAYEGPRAYWAGGLISNQNFRLSKYNQYLMIDMHVFAHDFAAIPGSAAGLATPLAMPPGRIWCHHPDR